MMNNPENNTLHLPSAEDVARAVEIYLAKAYEGHPTPASELFQIPAGADVAAWLMSDLVERSPDASQINQVRSFALRMGNRLYPHMKLRLSRPPNDTVFVFSVDTHDAMLKAPPGSEDYDMLEELKEHNASVAKAINIAWQQSGLLTEHVYLRQKIRNCCDGV